MISPLPSLDWHLTRDLFLPCLTIIRTSKSEEEIKQTWLFLVDLEWGSGATRGEEQAIHFGAGSHGSAKQSTGQRRNKLKR